MLVCALGDLLLDVVVRLDEPVAEDTDAYGRTRVGAGGQAANVAAWVAALGGSARFVGKRAADPAGRVVAAELERRGVVLAGPVGAEGTGTVVAISTPDGRRAMLSDRGVAVELEPEDLAPEWLDDADWLHVPGYSLVRSPLADAACAAAARAQRVSVDVSSTAAVRSLGVECFRARVAALRPEVVFATEEEAALVEPAAATVVVKRGARGCVVHRGAAAKEYDARPAKLVDATGAGDAFAAGFLLGGAELALDAAARCVATIGAMP